MTPAIKLLQNNKINYQVYEFEHDPNHLAYGLEAAEFLKKEHGVEPQQVFKTLIVETNNQELVVAIVGVTRKLDLKALAKVVGVKKVKMAQKQAVINSTGYIVGGVSPLGQKNKLKTVIDISASMHQTIFVSAGKRGVEVGVATTDIVSLTQAQIASISI